AAQEQIQFESENSNTICKYPDGHKALDIPYQRVDAINAEAEEKCTKIMNEAEARCRGYR
ncbi:MAG: Tetratricopeptide repeat protein, partial [Cyanobacteriota bacterium erpe_2018_sw_39hr_WHONDRS-SW48-000098_B_bin.30]|nr:Tetratricopeptide repeat protein [Cyanobacteriota bacterium erpe_2018_sw_39hr_WHONDRS-SW48-000098_B_bin.30]